MTRDDIIKMAREAGFWQEHIDTWMCNTKDIEQLAALVAAEKEREMQARVDTLYAMYEQACQHRDQLMDTQRATFAAMRGKTQ